MRLGIMQATAPEEVVSVAFEFFSSRTGFVLVGLEELPSC